MCIRDRDVAAQYAEKVRINPGNYVDAARTFKKLEYTDEAVSYTHLDVYKRQLFFIEKEVGAGYYCVTFHSRIIRCDYG